MPEPLSHPVPNTGDCDCQQEEMLCYDVIIIGGGVAGLSAAIYAARDGFRTLVLEGEPVSNTDMPGGALMLTESIENFPGFDSGRGEDLIENIKAQAEKFGAEILGARVEHITPNTEFGKLHRVGANGMDYKTRAIIIATGAVARNLDIHGEQEYWGRGVSTCATCDGWAFRNKTVVVIGGGDTAVEDATVLTQYATKVYLMHRRAELRAVGVELEHLRDSAKAELVLSATPHEILGEDGKVTRLQYIQHGETKELTVDGVFVAIGRDPATDFLHNTGIELDAAGYVLTADNSTRVRGGFSGIFAAGDAVDQIFRQAITSAGRAVEAALEARSYLLNRAIGVNNLTNDRLT